MDNPRFSDVGDSVKELINAARTQGVRAHIVETGAFDIMLSKMWRQLPEKPDNLDLRIRNVDARPVSIPLPPSGSQYPILRTNALAITECPRQCARIAYADPVTFHELNDKVWQHKPNAVVSFTDQILFWGSQIEIYKILDKEKVKVIEAHNFEDPVASITQSGIIKSFFEHALAQSLCHDKPLVLRKKGKTYFAVVNHEEVGDSLLQPIKNAVGYAGKPGHLTGLVSRQDHSFWAEAISIKLEEKGGLLWLLIRPDIWVTPLSMRESAIDFLRSKKIQRYNRQSYQLLDAWIKVFLGSVGEGQEATVSCYPDTDYSPVFKIGTRTAFSRGRGLNG